MTENEVLGFDPQDLFKEKNDENSQSQGNSMIYKTRPADSVSEDGVYRSTIKVIYNPLNPRKSFLEQQSYGMQIGNQFMTLVSSLTIDDKECPIFKSWKKCRYSDEGSVLELQARTKDKGGKGLYDKRFARYVIVQIIADKNQPDLVGSFKLWKLPTAIYNLIKQKQSPAEDSGKASIPVMDYLWGRSIDIEVEPGPDDKANPLRKTREITYSGEISDDVVSCINPDGSPLLTSDEQDILDEYVSAMTKVWKSKDKEAREALQAEINSTDNYKELIKIYARVLGQIKEWAPALDSLSYHEWTDDQKKFVNKWISIVESGNDPAKYNETEVNVVNNVTPETPVAPAEPSVPTSTPTSTPSSTVEPTTDETSDLPF